MLFRSKEVAKNAYIGAFVVTNSAGDIINPVTKSFYSDCGKYEFSNYYEENFLKQLSSNKTTNTTLAVIVTNIKMVREELIKVSELAQDGMARAIYPVHTNWDGDMIFSISTHCKNRITLNANSFDLVNFVGLAASDILIEAIKNSLRYANSLDNKMHNSNNIIM